MNLLISHKSEAVLAIKKLFIIIYVLMILEGVLRKWFFPSISSFLFFIKDPIVLIIYFYAFQANLFYKCAAYYLYLFISLLIILQAIVFMLINPEGIIIYAYGLRNYLLYIPLIFVAANCINANDIKRIARITITLAIPIAVLVFFQYTSPPTAYINKGLADEGFVFMVAEGVVRPYGTFTFTSGHVLFVISFFAFMLSSFIKTHERISGTREKIIYSVACLCLILLFFTTGSRSVYAYAFLIIFSLTVCNFLAPQKDVTIKLVSFYFIATLVFFIFSYTDTYQIMVDRNISAIDSEGSPILRAISSLFVFTEFFNSTPFFGFGIGSGTNAAAVLLRGTSEQGMGFLLAEDEWSRIVLELGYLIGGLYIIFRIFLVAWLLKLAFYSYKAGEIIPIILFGFIGSVVLNGVMTMQGTVLVYATIFSSLLAGAALSSNNKLAKRKHENT